MSELRRAAPSSPALRLDHLHATDYRLLRTVEVEFPDGIIGIVGHNGWGKSSLLEAIMFALWGVDAAGGFKNELLRTGGGDLLDELAFRLGPDHYLVRRRIHQKSGAAEAELFRNDVQIAVGNDPTNAAIVERLGGLKEARISRFVAQDELNAISVLKAADRKRLILHLLGIDAVEIAVADLRHMVLEFDRSIKSHRQLLPNLAAIASELANLEARAQALTAEQAAASAAVTAAEVVLTAAEASLATEEAGAEASAHQATTLALVEQSLAENGAREMALVAEEVRLDAVAARLAEATAIRETAEGHRDEYAVLEAAAALRRRIPELEAQQTALESAIIADQRQIEALRTLALAEPELAAREAALAAIIANVTADLALAENERTAEIKALARNREEQAAHAADLALADPAGGRCRSCGQPIEPAAYREHLTRALNAAQQEETAIIARGSAARARIDAAGESRAAAEAEREQVAAQRRRAATAAAELRLDEATAVGHRGQVSEVSAELSEARVIPYDEVRHGELADEAASTAGLDSVIAGYRAELGQRERIAAERRGIVERSTELVNQRERARDGLAAAGYDPAAHLAASAAVRSAGEALTQARLEVVRLEGENDRLGDALVRARLDRDRHANLSAEIARLLEERGLHEMVRVEMERFKVVLIGRIRPLLSRKASALFHELTDGRYSELSLDADYEMSFGIAGSLLPYRMGSGGERHLMNLCLRLAISELVNESTGVGQTFLTLDEVLGSQDDERRENIVTALPRLSGHFGQVLMVAHSHEVQDLFEHVIFVRYERATNTSTVCFPEDATQASDAAIAEGQENGAS